MRDFFKLYKDYIIKHPKAEYRTNDNAFDKMKLFDVYKNIQSSIVPTREDFDAIGDFAGISEYLHNMYESLYQGLKDNMSNLDLKGINIAEYIIACLNREYKVIWDKRITALDKVEKGIYYATDILNFKIESPSPEIGLLDARASMESFTDSCSLLLNYLRFNLSKTLTRDNINPNDFAGHIRRMYEMAQTVIVFKHSYDDILYNNGFVRINFEEKRIIFDYESHHNLLLLLAGDMMFAERRLKMMAQAKEHNNASRLYRYVTDRRIKHVKVQDGAITLDFGQGNPKMHKNIVCDLQAALDSYYEFLNGDITLPNFDNATIDEVISIWGALQYIALHICTYVNFDVSLFKREDFVKVPCKVDKRQLSVYVNVLTKIPARKILKIFGAFEADWGKYNDIWTSMLYPAGDYYLLPFYPLIYSTPYNIIDSILQKGGVSLDNRGKIFEKYLYNTLTTKKNAFPIYCMPTGEYGVKGDTEEIDVLIGLEHAVFVADAKCIHYSIDPKNYSEAWKRLIDGCIQAKRKAEFVQKHPEYFEKLGDYSKKKFIPFVVTNYPTFTGFSYDNVYIIDSQSFISYLQGGFMSLRELSLDGDSIRAVRRFYTNENEYSYNFEGYLKENPLKEKLLERMYIYDLPLMGGIEPWQIISKSAQLKNDPQFNISNKK